MKIISVCGIPYTVEERDFGENQCLDYGRVDYEKAKITINKNLSDAVKAETFCHEVIHAILNHLGYTEKARDEQFVQAIGNAVYQTFVPQTRVIPDLDEER